MWTDLACQVARRETATAKGVVIERGRRLSRR
jgi:hypothetical protein